MQPIKGSHWSSVQELLSLHIRGMCLHPSFGSQRSTVHAFWSSHSEGLETSFGIFTQPSELLQTTSVQLSGTIPSDVQLMCSQKQEVVVLLVLQKSKVHLSWSSQVVRVQLVVVMLFVLLMMVGQV